MPPCTSASSAVLRSPQPRRCAGRWNKIRSTWELARDSRGPPRQCGQVRGGAAGRTERHLDITQNEIHPVFWALARLYLALGRVAEAAASAEKAYRNFPRHSLPIALLAACLVRLGDKQRAGGLLVQEMGARPNPLWGRAWFHLLGSEIDAAADWYEKMIETRDVFAGIYANSPLYTAIALQPTLGQTGAHDEPSSIVAIPPDSNWGGSGA